MKITLRRLAAVLALAAILAVAFVLTRPVRYVSVSPAFNGVATVQEVTWELATAPMPKGYRGPGVYREWPWGLERVDDPQQSR